ncbi:glycosyltransferase family 9 protein [Legionella impletisoli]|uniref:ADP-heptose--LPS heptosyltransferase n=1 Tax=Legionella impletisoli TaxID=343510 RepID=A0A917NB02_9GAMM|nr:glycosyltransferase family 9 protein [Legionella impletisoli]GGI83077.1 ADP-heptose--LPS heptosyltransferase [Legionella impletisoli]
MIKSICIVRLSALGDVLMLVPLVRTLQASIPQAKITWVISRPAYDLVAGISGVEFIVINKPNGVGDYWRFAKMMRRRHFDVLLAAQASLRANLLFPFVRAKRKIGYDKRRAKDGHQWFVNEQITPGQDHTLEGFLKFATQLGIIETQITWNLPIGEPELTWARTHLPDKNGPLVLLNPAASKPERSWVLERYIALIRYLKSQWQATVVLTGGPGQNDKELAEAIEASISVDANLVGKTRPKQLLAVIKHADLMICPDTGPSHMAAAVGTPVIALHAVTSSDVSGPYPYRHLAVDYYEEAVKNILKKSPETNIWGTHAHGQDTMSLIPLDAVMNRVQQVLSGL